MENKVYSSNIQGIFDDILDSVYKRINEEVPLLKYIDVTHHGVNGFNVSYPITYDKDGKIEYELYDKQLSNTMFWYYIEPEDLTNGIKEYDIENIKSKASDKFIKDYRQQWAYDESKCVLEGSFAQLIDDNRRVLNCKLSSSPNMFFVSLSFATESLNPSEGTIIIEMNEKTFSKIRNAHYADSYMHNLFINPEMEDDKVLVFNSKDFCYRTTGGRSFYIFYNDIYNQIRLGRFEHIDVSDIAPPKPIVYLIMV